MSLLSRVKAKVLFLLAIVVFLTLPVNVTLQFHVKAIAPAVVWASSPDETLPPSPGPPPRRSAALNGLSRQTTERFTPVGPKASAARTTVSSRYVFGVLWRVYWATARF